MWFIYKTKFASGLSPVTASQMSMEWVIHPSYKYKRSPQFKQWMMKSDCRNKKKRTMFLQGAYEGMTGSRDYDEMSVMYSDLYQ